MKKQHMKNTFDPDWMFKPLLNTNTSTNYDGGKIEQEYFDEMGN